MGRLRQKRKRSKLCIHCGRPAPSGTCPACRIRRNRAAAEAAAIRVAGVTESVTVASRTSIDKDGRTRYHGRVHRGRMSSVDEDSADHGDILDEIRRWWDGMTLVRAPVNAAVGKGPLRHAKAEALARLHLARRMIDDVLTRHRYTVPVIVDDEP